MLFNPADIQVQTSTLTDFGISAAKSVRAANNVANSLDGITDSVENNELTAFWTDGHFSLYQVVASILKFTGSAKLTFSTWSITEEPIRALWQMQQAGMLTNIFGVVDHRIKINSPKGHQFAVSFFDKLILAKSHAKITVLESETAAVTIVGSANWTKNPRLEAGLILKNADITAFYKELLLTYDRCNEKGN